MMTYGGLQIVESWLMVDRHEDWSRVRSPSRAIRRMKYGHPQNIRYYDVPKKEAMQKGGTLVMHPEMARQLRELTRKQS
jgi:hypothetical protein